MKSCLAELTMGMTVRITCGVLKIIVFWKGQLYNTTPSSQPWTLNPPPYGNLPKLGVPFGGSYIKDYSIWGFILGSPYFGKLPYTSNGDPVRLAPAKVRQ